MTLNSKENCITSISARLTQTSRWRDGLRKKFPTDMRNARAATTLERLAGEACNLTDDEWQALQPHFNWASEPWVEALSEAARHVEFHRGVTTFSAFVQDLAGVLSEQRTAVA